MVKRALYGGAMECELDERYQDISAFRQVPDHQEVFCDPLTNESIVIEINERENIPDNEAIEYFFKDLAVANGCCPQDMQIVETKIEQARYFGDEYPTSTLIGIQNVAKFNGSAQEKHAVLVHLCAIRLDKVTSDIIISLNIPLQGPLSDEYPGSYTFQTLLQTLKVNNWALFG